MLLEEAFSLYSKFVTTSSSERGSDDVLSKNVGSILEVFPGGLAYLRTDTKGLEAGNGKLDADQENVGIAAILDI